MTVQKLDLEELETVIGGDGDGLKPISIYFYYKCGDCGYEFKEFRGVTVDECPKCHGHWIGKRKDCF